MQTIGCFIIIKKENNIVLVKRKDAPLWDLPGGRCNAFETIEACAIREAFEETGYRCVITKLVGTYHRPRFHDTQYIFTGEIHGGKEITDGEETKALRWFPIKHLPIFMIPN